MRTYKKLIFNSIYFLVITSLNINKPINQQQIFPLGRATIRKRGKLTMPLILPLSLMLSGFPIIIGTGYYGSFFLSFTLAAKPEAIG